MKRNDFYQLVTPLTPKLYRLAYTLLPDDLQAEQLVIDSFNAYLLKESKAIRNRQVNLNSKKESVIASRFFFKGILRHLGEIGVRRAIQLTDQMKLTRPSEYTTFYNLDPRVRLVMSLRYEAQFSVEEIEDIMQIPRFEVIEKIHNGRFLLMTDLNQGVNL